MRTTKEKFYDVVPNDEGGWEVRKNGKGKPLMKSLQKQIAISFAEDLCRKKNADLVIYHMDGSVAEQRRAEEIRQNPDRIQPT